MSIAYYDWNGWGTSWGWFLWLGVFFAVFSSIGNWGYTYRAHRRFRYRGTNKDATDFLNERYARGEISQSEFSTIKNEIAKNRTLADNYLPGLQI